MGDSQGRFVWYDLVTSDVKGAIRFYTDVIGWRTQPFGDTYVMWTAAGTPVGGVQALGHDGKPTGTRPHWMAHVTADDVDALAKKAASLGAKIVVPPEDIPTVGRFSVIADPQGAGLSLFTPSGPETTPPAEPQNGHFSWHELMAPDWEAAFRFYSQLFGWQKTEAVDSPNGIYQMYGKGGRTLGGMGPKPKNDPAPPQWLYYVYVDDLDAAVARAKTGGGNVLFGPIEVPGGTRIAQCKDPQSAAFALHGK